ncbi:MAG: HlyD family secretion protein [Pseudomonadota bacterium]
MAENEVANEVKGGRRGIRRWLGGAFALCLIMAGGGYGLHWYSWSCKRITTDDAYVQSQLAYVSGRLDGVVSEVLVKDNETVRPGQTLVRLDLADFNVAAERAQAALALAESQVAEQHAAVRNAEAGLGLAEAELAQAQTDHERSRKLFAEGVIARQRLDHDATMTQVCQAKVASARQELARARAALGEGGPGGHPLLRERRAALKRARMDLAYCDVFSPVAGRVTRKRVEVGDFVKAGQPLMVLVPTDGLWVEANFKETQISGLKSGMVAEVRLDSYPDTILKGRVESLMASTGAAMSLLPAENATGNWVRVVQRVPVKIVLDNFQRLPALRVGQSARVTVLPGG